MSENVHDRESIGALLRREREVRGVSLEEVALTTRIPLSTLRSLELGDEQGLPADVFVRGFLRSYGRALSLDHEALVARYDAEREGDDELLPLPSVDTPDRGRRFGMAIAFAVLLILFTLAISIVLRPATHHVPVEVSEAPSALTVSSQV